MVIRGILIASAAALALSACATSGGASGADDGLALAQARANPNDPAGPKASDPWSHHYFTTSDGLKLHYVEQGKGTPVILIHGAGGSAVGNWFNNGIAAKLVDTNRVIGIDMRGHGLSDQGDRSKMASDVLEFMAQQKIEKAHIGGYSMGGAITLRLMTSNPEKFITAHFGGSGITETAEWRDKVPADKTGEAPMEAKARAAYQAVQAARGGESRGSEVGNNAAALRERAAAAAAAAAAQPATPRPAAPAVTAPSIDLKSIKFPVIAVNGDHDRPYAKTHRMWRELENFTNVVLKDHGHLSAVMAGITPPEYADALDRFITENNPKR
jgi:pimeloyl-ACP methyl ester carboxylesterase